MAVLKFRGTAPFWSGGHASAGVAAPAPRWFFAEGATGDFFDTYLLVANPNDSAANVTYEYLLPDGTVITESRSVLGNSRFTVNVEAQHASLRNTAVSTVISSDLPIVADHLSTAGFSDDDVRGVMGGNWLRFFRSALPG